MKCYRTSHMKIYQPNQKQNIDILIADAIHLKTIPYYHILQLMQSQFPQDLKTLKIYLNEQQTDIKTHFLLTLTQHSSPLLQALTDYIVENSPKNDLGLQIIGNLSHEINGEQLEQFFSGIKIHNFHLLFWAFSVLSKPFPYVIQQIMKEYSEVDPNCVKRDSRLEYSPIQYFRSSIQRIYSQSISVDKFLLEQCFYGQWKENFWLDDVIGEYQILLRLNLVDLRIIERVLEQYFLVIGSFSLLQQEEFINLNNERLLSSELFPSGYRLFLIIQKQSTEQFQSNLERLQAEVGQQEMLDVQESLNLDISSIF